MNYIKELFDIIAIDVTAGYDTRDEIIENAVDALFEEADHDWLRDHATRITDKQMQVHRAASSKWTHTTDNDKLDEAFAELDRAGIVARQHFACCQSCGHYEIVEEMNKTRQFRKVYGYVFFHWQDTESAVRSEYLYLAYGSASGIDAHTRVVAKKIITVLERHGLPVQWDGELRKRIKITNILWQRRRNFELESDELG